MHSCHVSSCSICSLHVIVLSLSSISVMVVDILPVMMRMLLKAFLRYKIYITFISKITIKTAVLMVTDQKLQK